MLSQEVPSRRYMRIWARRMFTSQYMWRKIAEKNVVKRKGDGCDRYQAQGIAVTNRNREKGENAGNTENRTEATPAAEIYKNKFTRGELRPPTRRARRQTRYSCARPSCASCGPPFSPRGAQAPRLAPSRHLRRPASRPTSRRAQAPPPHAAACPSHPRAAAGAQPCPRSARMVGACLRTTRAAPRS